MTHHDICNFFATFGQAWKGSLTVSISACGMIDNNLSANAFSKPFIADNTTINTITPSAIPKVEEDEMKEKSDVERREQKLRELEGSVAPF